MKKNSKKIWNYALMLLITVLTLGPFLITLFMSLKSSGQGIYDGLLPTDPTLANFFTAFKKANLGTYFLNTIIVTAIAIPLNLLFCSLAAYPLARMDFKGRSVVLALIISTMMVPFQLYMAPLFQLSGQLGLQNTHIGLIIMQVSTAFGIFLMRQAYLRIPKELEESAYLDGANKFKVWYMVALPLVKPTLVTLAIFTFMGTWGDYLWPLLNTTESNMYTLSIGLAQLSQNFDGSNLKLISAASILTTIPTLLIFIWLQKYFISGATDGAVKG
ncbi:carbohydrate ABC transporter permease [Priestia megaterium]|jgi:putative chitobiose transport system permease protein|nr:carbohydrate ABC transporter permease [Priestia megaterium]RFB34215.1 carbohydrate ABC transporter permease [Bacillus sp. RC]AQU76807.1 sugar ABC transporter permease [Priestia megaterium]NGY69872.1 carbohydrate ABC transporter permease [Priestia megaterium]PET69648.1 carbohydrate ABC transporter permease [Priestia megaterium]PFE29056.1 carbohydrate ABC transporter permease [Priestia megaterium]